MEGKNRFLARLKTTNGGYKRYLGAPIRYPGGKSAAVGQIVELIPENVEFVVSPFLGGGSVEVALAKELGVKVLAFDIFDILVNFWKVLLDPKEKEKMIDILKRLKPNKKEYSEVKERLRRHWRRTQYGEGENRDLIKDKSELAALFFFNYQLSYGPGFLGWPSSVYLNERSYKRFIEKLEEFETPYLSVECSDFREVLPRFKNAFLYLDPPYYIGPDSSVFRGVYPQRNFPIHHHGFPHEELKKLLDQHRGGFVLSYNAAPKILQMYEGYKMIFPKWHYSMGLGETRIGKNRTQRSPDNPTYKKESSEVLIFCF